MPQNKPNILPGPERSCADNEFCTSCPARNGCPTRNGFFSQTRSANANFFSDLKAVLTAMDYPDDYINSQMDRVKAGIEARCAEESRLCGLVEECMQQFNCGTCHNRATCTFRVLLLKPEEEKNLSSIADGSTSHLAADQIITIANNIPDICAALDERAQQVRQTAIKFALPQDISYSKGRQQRLDAFLDAIRSVR